MYKTKEEVERPPIADHPCNLTRTAVKISFPAMKDEVFVNFLGYREPNLQYVLRCKGLCGDDTSSSQTACVPTKVCISIIYPNKRGKRPMRVENLVRPVQSQAEKTKKQKGIYVTDIEPIPLDSSLTLI